MGSSPRVAQKSGAVGLAQFEPKGDAAGSIFGGRLQASLGEGGALPRSHLNDREALDRLIEQAVEIEFRRQVQEDRAKTNGGAVHEHELTRYRNRAPGFERLVDPKGFLATIFGRLHATG